MSLEKLKENLLTIPQAASEKGCTKDTIYRALREGNLTRFKLTKGRSHVLRDKRYKEWEPREFILHKKAPGQMKSLEEIRAEENGSAENGSTEDDSSEDDITEDG